MMEFKNKEHPQLTLTEEVYLAPRSLLVLKDAARYEWSHSITARKTDTVDNKSIKRKVRNGFTFRKMKLLSGHP